MEKVYLLILKSLAVMGLTDNYGSDEVANLITALTKYRNQVKMNLKDPSEVLIEACRRFKD